MDSRQFPRADRQFAFRHPAQMAEHRFTIIGQGVRHEKGLSGKGEMDAAIPAFDAKRRLLPTKKEARPVHSFRFSTVGRSA